VSSTGQTTNFTYDFAGNLIQQTDSGPSTNLTQTFVLDDLTNVAYVNRSDGDQYSVLTGESIDSHLAVAHGNGQVEYGLGDAINSTVATVDQTGAQKGQFAYDPFGQTTATNSTYPFQFAGRVPVSSSLYYNRARFYNSQTGRFISEDPIGMSAGPNPYAYARGNPLSFIDPLGLDAKKVYEILKPIDEFLESVNSIAHKIGSAGAYVGTGDLGANQAINSNPLLNVDSGDPDAACNLQRYQSQFYGGSSLGWNQIVTGLNGAVGQDLWQYLQAVAKLVKDLW
jgi:RHS repeat-associated protein